MGNYVNLKDAWLKSRALGFLANFVRDHKGDITTMDTFNVVDEFRASADMGKSMSERFSDEECERIRATFPQRPAKLVPWELPSRILAYLWNCGVETERTREFVRDEIEATRTHVCEACTGESPFQTRFGQLCSALALDEVESEILLFALLVDRGYLSWPTDHLSFESLPKVRAQYIAKCLDCETDRVRRTMSNQGRLHMHECLDYSLEYNDDLDRFLDGLTDEPFVSRFFQRAAVEPVPWSSFGDTGEKHGELVARLVSTRGEDGKAPNILLHGQPGFGRARFAKAVAAHAGRECYFISDTEDFISRDGTLKACNDLFSPERSLFVIDNARDVLFPARWRSQNIFDETKIPTIWIADDEVVGDLPPSIRRRFDYSVRFESATPEERLRMWRDISSRLGLGDLLDDETLARFAAKHEIGAGDVAAALGTVARMRPSKEDTCTLLETLLAQREELASVTAKG